MAKTKPTLFDQLRDESRHERQSSTWATSPVIRWAILLVAVLAVASFFPGRTGETQRKVFDTSLLGALWTDESVTADYTFPVLKPADMVERERDSARAAAPTVVRFVADARTRTADALRVFADDVERRPDSIATMSPALRTTVAAMTPAQRRELVATFRQAIDPLVDAIYRHGFIGGTAQRSTPVVVLYVDRVTERLLPSSSIVDTTDFPALLDRHVGTMPDAVATFLANAVRRLAVPDLVADDALSQRARDEAAMAVPETIDIVRRGDVIIRKGSRVDDATLAKLTAYRDAQYLRSDSRFSILVIIGALGHASLIVGILVLFLYYLRRQSFERNGQLAGLVAAPIVSAAMAWTSIQIPTEWPLEYVILIPAVSMLISVLFDARTAVVTTLVMALTVSGVRGNDYPTALVLMIGGMVAAYSTNNIQSRTQLFTSMLSILVGMLAGTTAVDLERAIPFYLILPKLILAATNAIASPLITVAVILAMERIFNVATDLRLEEYDNLNHPLLRQLNERAPGTYQHTIAVARLAEAGANAIGANALLAKVGALFHDIGKLEKSEYFVENQIDIGNKHDKLPPKKSAAIIRQHIQDGLDLAKQYHLPNRISKFIPMHHGTILIKHFYAKAVDATLLKDTMVDEQDYRYPGPRPDSVETAIVMLADASEALSRLVDTSSREDLESAVETIIVDRFLDGQLANAPLTTRDLELVKDSFVKNLLGTTHQRVRYKEVPTKDAPSQPTDEAPATP